MQGERTSDLKKRQPLVCQPSELQDPTTSGKGCAKRNFFALLRVRWQPRCPCLDSSCSVPGVEVLENTTEIAHRQIVDAVPPGAVIFL
jgi:hypothetical protein